MSLEATLIGLLLSGAAFGFAVWRSLPAPDPTRPRLVPWTAVLLVAATAVILFLVHLVNLAGVTTGRAP